MDGMNTTVPVSETARYVLVVGLIGAIATAHYVVSPPGDAPEAPPMASVSSIIASTSAMTDGRVTVDAITDAEYHAPAIDMRHPAAPTRGAASLGVVMFKSPPREG